MRLLIINPNSSKGVTRHIATAARGALAEGDEILAMEAAGAPALIVNERDAQRAERAVVETVRELDTPVDGVIVASFGDTGANALRAFLRCPVVGIGHASLLTAAALGGPFAIVSFAPAVVPSMRWMVEDYRMQHLLSGIHTIDTPLPEDPGDIQGATRDALLALCQRVAQQKECRSIILGGGPLAGLAPLLAGELSIPLIDPTRSAVMLQYASGTFIRAGNEPGVLPVQAMRR